MASKKPDAQKSLLYAAEVRCAYGEHFNTINDIQRYVNAVTGSRWWKQHAPGLDYIECRAGSAFGMSRGASAVSKTYSTLMLFKRHGRYQLFVLHEMAHQLCDHMHGIDHDDIEPHGELFAHWYVKMVEHFMGPDNASRLRSMYEQNGVKYVPSEQMLAKRPGAPKERLHIKRPSVADYIPGEVRRRRNALTESLMVMVDSRKCDGRYPTPVGEPWVVICATHDVFSTYRTRQDAKDHMGYPNWCAACARAIYPDLSTRNRTLRSRLRKWGEEKVYGR